MKITTKLVSALTILATLALLVAPAFAAGGDFSLDFIASAPFTYDHATGGGAYNDRDIGKYDDTVESLEGGDFLCGDTVTYLTAITVDAAPADANQTIEMTFRFLAETTGQPGVAHGDVSYVGVNYGNVENGGGGGLGVFAPDTGFVGDDGGSSAWLVSEEFTPNGTTPFNGADELVLVIRVDDLEAGEQVIVRIDTILDCLPGSSPTGNLQGKLESARVVEADGQPVDDTVPGGAQTIPFKQIGNIIPPEPTAVVLASFEAASAVNGIRLSWETASEFDVLGFNLYRAESPDGQRIQLNKDLIAAQSLGSSTGASYEFVDETALPRKTYYYWLQDLDLRGGSSYHGPVEAQVELSRLLRPVRPRLIAAPPSLGTR